MGSRSCTSPIRPSAIQRLLVAHCRRHAHALPRLTARIALKRGMGVGGVAIPERRVPNRPAQRRLALCVPGRGSEAGPDPTAANPADLAVESGAGCTWVEDPFMRTGCFLARGADRAADTRQDLCAVITACVLAELRPAASVGWARSTALLERVTRVLATLGLCELTGRGADTALTAQEATYAPPDSAARRPGEAAGRRRGRSGWRRSCRSSRRTCSGRCCA